MQPSPFTNFPVGIVPDAKCRVGITLDVEKRKSTYKDDWPHAGNFKVVYPTPLARQDAALYATHFAKGCGCEYDYEPDERTSFGEWYVYHFYQGGRGTRALPERMRR